MSSRSKREYLEAIYTRYKAGTRKQKKLTDLFKTLNPFLLRKAMEKRLKEIFQLCCKNSC